MKKQIDFSKKIAVQRQVVYEGPFYTEGPVCNGAGLYFTDLMGGLIRYWNQENGVSCCVVGGWPNGQTRDKAGNWLVCDSQNRRVIRYDAHWNFIENAVDSSCAGLLVTTPNDVIADENGGIYFTDSVRQKGYVFYRSAKGEERAVVKKMDYPNGLALSADERYLFVAESYANRIMRIDLIAPGTAADTTPFCELPYHSSGRPEANLPDGMAVDLTGRLWVAHYGMGAVQVIDGRGNLLASLETGIPLTSNVCLLDGNRLAVTGGDGEPGPGKVVILTLKNS